MSTMPLIDASPDTGPTYSCRLQRMAIAVGCVFASASAHAELGAPVSSVATDQVRMHAQARLTAMGRYNRHELTRLNGGVVHEFANADGKVFAVSWAGPGKPDLRSLLGGYFATFQASGASIGRTMHALRRPPQVDQPNLQIQTSGHMGWFRGIAFIPSLAPQGMTAADLPAPQ